MAWHRCTAASALLTSPPSHRSASSVSSGLASLPALQTVVVSGMPDEQLQELAAGLPETVTLRVAAGQQAGAPAEPQPSTGASPPSPPGAGGAAPVPRPSVVSREITISEKDLSDVAVLFGAIKSLVGDDPPGTDARLTSAFDSHVSGVVKGLSALLGTLEDPISRQSAILSAKFDLYDVCFSAALEAVGSNTGLSASLRQLRKVHTGLFKEFPGIIEDVHPYYAARVGEAQEAANTASRKTAQLLRAAESLEREVTKLRSEKDRMAAEIAEERDSLLADKRVLSRENAELRIRVKQLEQQLGTARAHASSSARGSAGAGTAMVASPPPAPAAAGAGRGGGSPTRRGDSPTQEEDASTARTLTLNQLREVIDAMYASKVKFDAKCDASKLPRETMEQHMYTFLNQKYGLKRLIIEHASAIIRGVNAYSDSDNDVRVFGCILRNDIDEEFRLVQRQLKNTVSELLRVYLKGKHPMKPDSAIGRLMRSRLTGHVVEAEWVEIIRYMYSDEDAATLINLVRTTIATKPEIANPPELESKSAEEAAAGGGRGPRRPRRGAEPTGPAAAAAAAVAKGRIAYDALLKILLDFQLRGHEKFLARFRKVFRAADTDGNGVVNEVEFRKVVKEAVQGKSDAEVDELLAAVDPYNNNHITFSDCVGVLSSDLVAMVSGGSTQPAA